MVFQFNTLVFNTAGSTKWHYTLRRWMCQIEEIFTKWQTELGKDEGWNSLFGTTTISHSCVNLEVANYRAKSVGKLCAILHLMERGLRISIKEKKSGMTNYPFQTSRM